MPVFIAPYDPLWPREFDAEAARIERACRGLPLRLEHVGSTAVPGLAAKPIVDILAGVPPDAPRAPYVAAIRALGYGHKGSHGIPGRDYFQRGSPRTHHVHLVSWTGAFWRDELLFRDHLRAHPDVARDYEALKRELAIAFAEDRRGYSDAKGPFIARVLREARAAARP